MLTLSPGRIYMVVSNDDSQKMPNFEMEAIPQRRTIRWRGKRFNVPTFRVVLVGTVKKPEIPR